MSLFRQSTTSFGDAKAMVASQGSKQSTPEMLLRAGVAIQQAFQDWNRYNWQWAVTSPQDSDRDPYQVAIGQSNFILPWDFKDVYDIVLKTGNSWRALRQDTKRSYDRAVPFPMNSFTVAYNLQRVGDRGELQVQNPPDSPGTLTLLYHRVLTQPCYTSATATAKFQCDGVIEDTIGAVATAATGWYLPYIVIPASAASKIKPGNIATLTKASPLFSFQGMVAGIHHQNDGTAFLSITPRVPLNSSTWPPVTGCTLVVGSDDLPLDIHADHEAGLLAKATEIFLSSVGASDQRLAYWNSMAERGIDKALASQADHSDLDLAFEPMAFNSFNPNRVPE